MKNLTFPGKNQLRPWPTCWIERALYAKTSHSYRHYPRVRGILSAPGGSVGFLGAEVALCLYRCFWEKAVGRRGGQILSEENHATVCRGFEDRSKTAPGGHDCRGTCSRALAFE